MGPRIKARALRIYEPAVSQRLASQSHRSRPSDHQLPCPDGREATATGCGRRRPLTDRGPSPVALLLISRIWAATVRFRYGYAGVTGASLAFGEAVDALT
jgi:hypothetical protein